MGLSVLYNNALTKLYVRVDILLTRGKDLHDPIMPLRQNAWTHKTRLILPIIEMFKKTVQNIYALYRFCLYFYYLFPLRLFLIVIFILFQ